MADISQIKLPDSTIQNLRANKLAYGECSTAAATVAKSVTVMSGANGTDTSTFILEKGSVILVKFTATNTGAVANLTLNVNNTGAKNVKYRNSNLSSAGILAANRIYAFVYDGTYWQLIGDLDTNTTSIPISSITGGYVRSNIYFSHHPEGLGGVLPFLYNDLAFLTEKGGTVTTYITTATDYTPLTINSTEVSIDMSNAFDCSPSYVNPNRAKTDKFVIDITCHKTFTYSNRFYIDFGSDSWRANAITILVMNSATEAKYTQKTNISNNSYGHYTCSLSHSSTNTQGTTVQGFNRIRIVLTNFQGTQNRIAQIGLINYGSAGMREGWMSRGIDDSIYRNITPSIDDTYSLGSSNKKWANIYATTPASTDNSTKVATTAFVKAQGYTTNTGNVTGSSLTANNIILGNSNSSIKSGGKTITTSIADTSTDDTVPTSKAVKTFVDSKIAAADAMIYKGTIGNSTATITTKTLPNTTAKTGWTYKVVEAGNYTIGTGTTTGTTTVQCEIGDMIICLTDGSTSVYATWTVVQNNVDLVGTQNSIGLIKNGSNVTSSSGYTASPIINGIPYYKDTNTTYSAGTGLSLSGITFNHSNSVTAGTAQGDANKTLTFGGTFTIPTITYDAQGHITGKGTTTMTMPANPNTNTAKATGTATVLSSTTTFNAGTNPSLSTSSWTIYPVTSTTTTATKVVTKNWTIPNVTAAGTAATATVSNGILTLTNGTAPTLGTAITVTGVSSNSNVTVPVLSSSVTIKGVNTWSAGTTPTFTPSTVSVVTGVST